MPSSARAFLLVAFLSALAIAAAYQFNIPYRVQIAPGDRAYVRDFWDLESDLQGNIFRWSKAKSEIIFHNAGQILSSRLPVTLELRIASARPQGSEPPLVHLTLYGAENQDLGTFRATNGLGTQRFTFDPTRAGDGDWTVEIGTETFLPAGDNRELGIQLRRAILRADDARLPLLPILPSALYGFLVPPLLFLFALQIGTRLRIKAYIVPATLASLGTILLISIGIVLFREETVLYLPPLFLISFLLGAWSCTRIVLKNDPSRSRAAGAFLQLMWLPGLGLLIIGESTIWLMNLISLGAVLLAAGAVLTFVSERANLITLEPRQHRSLARFLWPSMGVTMLLAAGMRVYHLDQVLFGLFRDETRMGLLGLRVLNDPGYRPIYEGPPISQSGLLIYFLALAFKFVGASLFSLRLVGAFAGVLTVGLVWRVARDWFQLPVALTAAFGMAIGTMHVYYSRFTLPYVESPLLSIPAYILLGRGLRDNRLSSYALAGVFFGATQYASQISRVSILVGAFMILDEVIVRRRLSVSIVRGVALMCLCALLVLSPLLSFAARAPGDFLARTEQVSLFGSSSPSGDYPVTLLWNNVAAYAGIFNVVGDSHGGHVVPTRPEFDPVFGTLFLVGFIHAAKSWRERANRRVLFWLFAALLPGLLSIEAPAPLRVLEAPAPTFILAGLGAMSLLHKTAELTRSRLYGGAAANFGIPAVTILLAGLAFFTNARVYFGELGNDARLWEKNQAISTPVGATLNAWLAQNRFQPATEVYAPDWFTNSPDDRDVLNFTTGRQIKFLPLSREPSIANPPLLVLRPNIIGYWKTIGEWQHTTKIPGRWPDEDTQTVNQIRTLGEGRQMTELRGPNFPVSEEATFWLYLIR